MILNCTRESKSWCIFVPASFFWWRTFGYNKVLCYSIGRKIYLEFSGCSGRASCELVYLKCPWYNWCFFNITRFTKNHIWFLKQRCNWRAKLVCSLTKSSTELMIIWHDFNWQNTTFCNLSRPWALCHDTWLFAIHCLCLESWN